MAKQRKIPNTRINKFYSDEDYRSDIEMGREAIEGDNNITVVLFRIDRVNTTTDDVYGESLEDGIQFLPPVEFKGYVTIESPDNQNYANSNLSQMEPGNLKVGVYQDALDELNIDIDYGDYLGYYETEDRVRYYSVVNDGRVVSDNKHTYGGYKPFYRSIIAAPVNDGEFRGI